MWKRVLAGATATLTLGAGTTAVLDKRADPYTDKGTHYELPIQSDIPQGERVEISKEREEMTLKGWNDEYAITITPLDPQLPVFGSDDKKLPHYFVKDATRPLLSKKMEYRQDDITAFIAPKEDSENEFDIDFTLHAKPDTNVFEYQIAGAEDFDFFYQPELTPEEIAEGVSRPENVVGSYAVYHKTKANHRVGDTNYATGKAFHIYRPKAIDANGAEVWAELSYSEAILAVTVPQEWLEKAAYPVQVDPTFGYTTEGASNLPIASATSDQSQMLGNTFSLSESGTLTKITAAIATDHFANSDTVDTYVVIYREDSAGLSTHDLVAAVESLEQTIITFNSSNWIDFTASSESLSVDDYIFAAVANGEDVAAVNNIILMLDTINTRNRYSESSTGAGSYAARKENPWTETLTSGTRDYSIYATYTASGGGGDAVGNTYFEVLD